MKTLLFPEPAIVPTSVYEAEVPECPNCKIGFSYVPPEKERTYTVPRIIEKSITLDQRAMGSLDSMEKWIGVSDLVVRAERNGLKGVKLEDPQYDLIKLAIEKKWKPVLLAPLRSLFQAIRAAGSTDGTEEIPSEEPAAEEPAAEEAAPPQEVVGVAIEGEGGVIKDSVVVAVGEGKVTGVKISSPE